MALLIPSNDTLVTYYMLPLIGLNKNSFWSSFKTSYIDKDGSRIYVELGTNMRVPSYKGSPQFITEIVDKGNLIVMFIIPAWAIPDGTFFVEGRYSEMSKQAKNIIYKTSTLPYNKTMGSFKNSDPILQALDKTKTLRTWLEAKLGITTLDDSAELITKPLNHWFIENRLT